MDLQQPPDFKEFLKLLKDHEVRHLLIGGYAVGYHGYPRATEDLDIWIEEKFQVIFNNTPNMALIT